MVQDFWFCFCSLFFSGLAIVPLNPKILAKGLKNEDGKGLKESSGKQEGEKRKEGKRHLDDITLNPFGLFHENLFHPSFCFIPFLSG